MTTVAPASAVPLTTMPLLAVKLGASGGVVSGAVTVIPELLLPEGSVTTTETFSPLISGGLKMTSNCPSAPTGAVASATPSPLVSTLTVLPGSARPVSLLPSGAICSCVDWAGAMSSGARNELLALRLPFAARTRTVISSPLFMVCRKFSVNTPLLSATTV